MAPNHLRSGNDRAREAWFRLSFSVRYRAFAIGPEACRITTRKWRKRDYLMARARGRKSGISLTVVPPTLPGERPAPPAEFDTTEERIWRAIVGALPPTWLDAAAQSILTRAVAQAAVCELLEAQLRALRAQDPADTDAIGALAAQHAAAGHMLGTLRATPPARMVPRGASRQIAPAL